MPGQQRCRKQQQQHAGGIRKHTEKRICRIITKKCVRHGRGVRKREKGPRTKDEGLEGFYVPTSRRQRAQLMDGWIEMDARERERECVREKC